MNLIDLHHDAELQMFKAGSLAGTNTPPVLMIRDWLLLVREKLREQKVASAGVGVSTAPGLNWHVHLQSHDGWSMNAPPWANPLKSEFPSPLGAPIVFEMVLAAHDDLDIECTAWALCRKLADVITTGNVRAKLEVAA